MVENFPGYFHILYVDSLQKIITENQQIEWVLYVVEFDGDSGRDSGSVLRSYAKHAPSRELSSDCYSKVLGQESGNNLPYSRHINSSIDSEAFPEEDLDMRGAQEKKKDHCDDPQQLFAQKEDEQEVDISSGQSSPTSLTTGQSSSLNTNETPGRIGRQRSFMKKPSYDPTMTQSDLKTVQKERNNVERTPTFVLEKQEVASEEIVRQPIARRPTGWVRHVEWKGNLDGSFIDEDGIMDPPPEDTTSSTSSTPSTPSSQVQSDVNDQVYDEDRRNLSKRPSSPLFSPERQPADTISHFIGSLKQKSNFKVHLYDTMLDRQGSKCPLGHSTPSPPSPSSTSSISATSSGKSQNSSETLDIRAKSHINEALCTNRLQPNAQQRDGEVVPAAPKTPSSRSIIPVKSLARFPEVRYLRRRSSSGLPTQESDLLKEWTQNSLQDLQERGAKSRDGQKKVLEAAQKARDFIYEQRRIEIKMKREKNREQEKKKIDETLNSKGRVSMNHWELVVSLIDLERPTGPPSIEKEDKTRLLGTPSQLQLASSPLVVRTRALPVSKIDGKQDNEVVSVAGSEETAVVEEPLVKSTDLSRMKEVLIKLTRKRPIPDVGK